MFLGSALEELFLDLLGRGRLYLSSGLCPCVILGQTTNVLRCMEVCLLFVCKCISFQARLFHVLYTIHGFHTLSGSENTLNSRICLSVTLHVNGAFYYLTEKEVYYLSVICIHSKDNAEIYSLSDGANCPADPQTCTGTWEEVQSVGCRCLTEVM